MPFPYYDRLSKADKRIYDQSDAITSIRIPNTDGFAPIVLALRAVLERGDRLATQQVASQISRLLLKKLGAPPLKLRVLAVRPAKDWGELQGLYEPAEGRQWAQVTVWMRTAKKKRPVAFKTFLRTILHELGHHLDYELLELEDSFHTEGFFKRESSLFYQLMGSE